MTSDKGTSAPGFPTLWIEVRVVAPHFVCGITISGDQVVDAAPIMRWAVGKRARYVLNYAHRKGWDTEEIEHRATPS